MKPTGRAQTGWRLALGGLALALATSGCFAYIMGHSGVSGVGELYIPKTRAEVREAFGEADKTGTCPDGRPVEWRAIRRQDPNACRGAECVRGLGRTGYDVLFVAALDLLLAPYSVYHSERLKLHYAFVYDTDDRVVYRYNVKADPLTRFWEAAPALTDYWPDGSSSLPGQTPAGGCTSRAACFSAYATELRHRAACVDYPLTSQDDETLQLMQTLAAEVDAGHLAPDDTLEEFQWCLRSTPFSCFRP